ncbi:hypothetical protein AGLY_011204, partial [Aphis glycines]
VRIIFIKEATCSSWPSLTTATRCFFKSNLAVANVLGLSTYVYIESFCGSALIPCSLLSCPTVFIPRQEFFSFKETVLIRAPSNLVTSRVELNISLINAVRLGASQFQLFSNLSRLVCINNCSTKNPVPCLVIGPQKWAIHITCSDGSKLLTNSHGIASNSTRTYIPALYPSSCTRISSSIPSNWLLLSCACLEASSFNSS